MSIYTKSMTDITTADLQELLDEKAVENIRLEFKLEIPHKDEMLKKLSSFANTFGGYAVIGAKANSKDGFFSGSQESIHLQISNKRLSNGATTLFPHLLSRLSPILFLRQMTPGRMLRYLYS